MMRESHNLDAERRQVLEIALKMVPLEGWTDSMLRRAAEKAGVLTDHNKLAFPKGVHDLIHFYSQELDANLLHLLDAEDLDPMKVRKRIEFAVRNRIDLLRSHKAAAKRVAAYLALPQNAFLASWLIYSTCDAIWHGIGDRSTDINFYTKRGTLAGVYSSTLLFWLGDESAGSEASWNFLSRRIENVMEFEVVKVRVCRAIETLPSREVC
jgi:ubiquinone biosynthesis protein COQ9